MRRRLQSSFYFRFALCALMLILAPGFNKMHAQDSQFQIDASALSIERVVHLRNGDVISGRLISETEREYTLMNRAVGQVVVPKSQVLRVEERNLDAPQLPTAPKATASPKPAPAPAAGSPTNQIATAVKSAAPAPVGATNAPGTNVVAAAKPPPTPAPKPKESEEKPKGPKLWNTDLQLGLNLRWGRRDSEDFFTTVRSTYAKEKIKHTFDGNFTYGTTDEVISANRLTTSSKLEYNYSKRWYVYNLLGAGYDEVRKIDFQYEFGPGSGFEILQRTNFVLKAEAGLTYTDRDRTDAPSETIYSARFAAIYTWKIWEKLTTEGRFEVFPSLESVGDLRMRLESTFRYPLWKNVSLNVNFIDIYETDPAPGVPKNDLQVRSALGIRF